MYTVWIVSTVSVGLLIPVVRACVWFLRWNPLDFLGESADPGPYCSGNPVPVGTGSREANPPFA